jgi:acetate CoA/acetoacetate CoA-transferase alpha subunit
MDKVLTLDQAFENVHDGSTIMLGGFLGIGTPIKAIDKLVEMGVRDLTIISVANAYPRQDFDIALLYRNKQIKKLITSHAGTTPIALDQYANGDIEIEYFPMGSFIEKIRAGGAGLGGVLTPTGLGTLVEEGKEKLTIAGREFLLELPLRADFAFVKGYRADRYGNVQYRGVALNSNPVMATAADFTFAEVNEIVEVGSIQPESVGTPGVFVQGVYQGHPFEDHKKIYTDLWIRSNQLK